MRALRRLHPFSLECLDPRGPSAGLGTLFCVMWIFLTLGLCIAFCVVLVLNVLAVAFASVLARHAEPRDELGPELRVRLVTYGR